MLAAELPIPPHFDAEKVAEVWRVPYQEIAEAAAKWAARHGVAAAAEDRIRICLLAIDVQNTFCIPDFALYVGGRSGCGSVDDNHRLCAFIYRNLARITRIVATMDTHRAVQIFHSIFLVDAAGNHPPPFTLVSAEDVARGRWRFNPRLSEELNVTPEEGQRHLEHYTRQLERSGKYALTIWPYHAMLGGIGHALVAAVEEAVFFHTIARQSQPEIRIKGDHPLTEHYSALGPEVATGPDGMPLVEADDRLIRTLDSYDAVIIAGQAKSHCVAWTVADLLDRAVAGGRDLAGKIYLLEDCTSPVVIPGVIDYTEEADAAFARFAERGAHRVRSTDPMQSWPEFPAG